MLSGGGGTTYRASRDNRELCRFVWTLGATVFSAELQIEFESEADEPLRALAIALAPVLEFRSRLASERRLPTVRN